MAKPILDPRRSQIRAQAAYLSELELLEMLEGGSVSGFDFLIKKVDGLTDKFGTYYDSVNKNEGVIELRRRFFKEKLENLINEYREHIAVKLAGE